MVSVGFAVITTAIVSGIRDDYCLSVSAELMVSYMYLLEFVYLPEHCQIYF